jgi:hypothetical protein
MAGFVRAVPYDAKGFRHRYTFFVAAGPISDVLLIWLLRDSVRRIFGNLTTASQSASGVVLSALFLLTAFSTALGLIPHKMRFGSLALIRRVFRKPRLARCVGLS